MDLYDRFWSGDPPSIYDILLLSQVALFMAAGPLSIPATVVFIPLKLWAIIIIVSAIMYGIEFTFRKFESHSMKGSTR